MTYYKTYNSGDEVKNLCNVLYNMEDPYITVYTMTIAQNNTPQTGAQKIINIVIL